MLQYGRKKFVRYDEGAKIYSMGLHSFQNLAKDAGALKGLSGFHPERVKEEQVEPRRAVPYQREGHHDGVMILNAPTDRAGSQSDRADSLGRKMR